MRRGAGVLDPNSLTPDQAEMVFRAVQPSDPTTLMDLEVLRYHPVAVPVAGRLLSESGASDELLYAAATVWAASGDDPALIRPLLQHPNPTVRFLAAAGCAIRGDATGLLPIIDTLSEDKPPIGSQPPVPLWCHATMLLARLTARSDIGPPLDADNAVRERAQANWHSWLSSGAPVFEAATGVWRSGA